MSYSNKTKKNTRESKTESSQEHSYDWSAVWERVQGGGCAGSLEPCAPCGGIVHKVMDEILQKEAKARAEGKPTYVDPKTGYTVLTAKYLASRGYCCGNGCRHCPFGHVNVKKQS